VTPLDGLPSSVPTRTSSFGLWPTPTLAGACVSVSSTTSYAESLGPEAVQPGEAALRGSSRVVPRYWGVRPVWHQLGTPIIPKSSVRRASHPKGCDDLRKAELGSHCIRTRDKDTHEAVVERAVGQDAGPVSIRIICRSVRRSDHSPKRQTIRPLRLSDTRASRRASSRARLQSKRYTQAVGNAAGHASNHPPKRHKRAVGQDAGPASNHPPKRREQAAGQDTRRVSTGPSAEAP